MNPFRLTTRRIRSQARAPGPPLWPLAPPSVAPRRPRWGVTPGPAACAVPWRVVRSDAGGVIELQNVGGEPLASVRFALAGSGMLGLSLPCRIEPGERLRVVVRGSLAEGAAAGADAMLVVRWFRPDGSELLWPIAL
ncbi:MULTISPECIES: hypothetical protein [unclassified Leucobacter]|uniref:hypothetical protein n=1 Tax=unclassified Leucobacter TaxID=2621730 RepID=UPI00165DC022|nr:MULTISPECIES: hypothetical protein [unclassified Leucobacter]MBC9937652.1 hypothetical protein [Leucobacter sp. cx-87]